MTVFFLFQEDGKAEENMAQKRAALLEKRMRREKESLQKKLQLEAELEQKKEEARYDRNTFYLKHPPLKTNSLSCFELIVFCDLNIPKLI